MSANQPWSKVQERLLKWQAAPSAWELRRILSDSEHFREIAIFAARRAKGRPEGVSWQDWWGFYLEKMPEQEAIKLLLEVWNKDLKAFLAKTSRQRAEQLIGDIAEHSRKYGGIRVDLRFFGNPEDQGSLPPPKKSDPKSGSERGLPDPSGQSQDPSGQK